MRFNEFNNVNEDTGLPTEKGTRDWIAKSAVSRFRDPNRVVNPDPAEVAYLEKPAYQRAGKPEPITRPVPGTKPNVNLADPKQAAAYKAALDSEKPIINKATGSVGTVSPGEPTMGVNNPETKIKSGVNPTVTRTEPTMGPSTSPKPSNIPTLDPVKDAAGKAATKSLGRRALGKVIPYAGSALDAEEAYNRYQRGDRSGAVISALGAAGGLVPGLGAPVSWGAMGLNAIKDATGLTDKEEAAYQARQAQAAQQEPSNTPGNVLAQPSIKQALQTSNANIKNYKDNQAKLAAAQSAPGSGSTYVPPNLTPSQQAKIKPAPVPLGTVLGTDDTPAAKNYMKQRQLAAAQAAQGSGSTVQRPTYTTDQQAIKDRIANTQAQQQTQQSANTGIEQPRQPRQSYAGTPGAQAIQRANPNTIQDVNSIKAGDTINLPTGGQYTVKPGDTLDKIAHNELTAPSTTQASTTQPNDNGLEKPTEFVPKKTTNATIAPPIQAEETNPLHRIKSLAGLK
jgi:hypothetical protein